MIRMLRVVQDSSSSGAGYEQGLKSGAEELVKGGKEAKKKVGATINKKANTGGKQVLLAALAYPHRGLGNAQLAWWRVRLAS